MTSIRVVAVVISCVVLLEVTSCTYPIYSGPAPDCYNPKIALFHKYPLIFKIKQRLCKKICQPLAGIPLCPPSEGGVCIRPKKNLVYSVPPAVPCAPYSVPAPVAPYYPNYAVPPTYVPAPAPCEVLQPAFATCA
ncbi:uncharacterized protein LOC132697016 [Cylas formicarius]|uniref:uncharacterized protein LOC132697016 n=1 Tax=Cylas formicarius TaxID=197179 RepID=UPI0029589B60|nr:uncharacterized protein LOC132697016 [Cylas formicarius]